MLVISEKARVSPLADLEDSVRGSRIVIEDGVIVAIGEGRAPADETARRLTGAGLLATPGLVNCHHHLYQWSTRGYAQDEDLFHWLVALYPRWALIDSDVPAAAATSTKRRGRVAIPER